MGTASKLIAFMEALVTQVSSDAAITALCTVYDGPPIVNRSAATELWLGSTGLDEGADTMLQRRPTAFGGGPSGALRQELYTVPFAIWDIGGETAQLDLPVRRARIGAVFDALCANLSSGGGDLGIGQLLCGTVEVSEGVLTQRQTPDGYAAVLVGSITAEAQI